jgi:hypothetical protein
LAFHGAGREPDRPIHSYLREIGAGSALQEWGEKEARSDLFEDVTARSFYTLLQNKNSIKTNRYVRY